MAVPKGKTSKARRNKRFSTWMHFATEKIANKNTVVGVKCPTCGEPRQRHCACRHCGTYKKRTIIDV